MLLKACTFLFLGCAAAVHALNIEITGSVVRTIDLNSLEDDVDIVYEEPVLSINTKKGHPHPHPHSDEDSMEEHSDEFEGDDFDSWSIIWYIASFGGLIAFFLIVSCSEWCCRKHIREQQSRRTISTSPSPSPSAPDTPPPCYDLFAPPSYESLNYARSNSEKSEYDVYVVPVHAMDSLVETNEEREDEPPSYATVNIGDNEQERRTIRE